MPRRIHRWAVRLAAALLAASAGSKPAFSHSNAAGAASAAAPAASGAAGAAAGAAAAQPSPAVPATPLGAALKTLLSRPTWQHPLVAVVDLGRDSAFAAHPQTQAAYAVARRAVLVSPKEDPVFWSQVVASFGLELAGRLHALGERVREAAVSNDAVARQLDGIRGASAWAHDRRLLAQTLLSAQAQARVLLDDLSRAPGVLLVNGDGTPASLPGVMHEKAIVLQPYSSVAPHEDPAAVPAPAASKSGGLPAEDKALLAGILAGVGAGAAFVLSGIEAAVFGAPLGVLLAVGSGIVYSAGTFKPFIDALGRKGGIAFGILNATMLTGALGVGAAVIPNVMIPIATMLLGSRIIPWAYRKLPAVRGSAPPMKAKDKGALAGIAVGAAAGIAVAAAAGAAAMAGVPLAAIFSGAAALVYGAPLIRKGGVAGALAATPGMTIVALIGALVPFYGPVVAGIVAGYVLGDWAATRPARTAVNAG
ncbi:MAG: hypothetical protein HY553_23050 [Elusimicrobia bacterium]|nr:hypothetical protein [Elusimicrobiota bacterium]